MKNLIKKGYSNRVGLRNIKSCQNLKEKCKQEERREKKSILVAGENKNGAMVPSAGRQQESQAAPQRGDVSVLNSTLVNLKICIKNKENILKEVAYY